MKTQDLCVFCKPSEATDSMGGDLPWQGYSYLAAYNPDNNSYTFTCDLHEAMVLEYNKPLPYIDVIVRMKGYRVVTLDQAIKQEMTKAKDIG